MRRLARHLFTFCSVVSLLLIVAVCLLWVRSYWVADIVERGIVRLSERDASGISVRGQLALNINPTRQMPETPTWRWYCYTRTESPAMWDINYGETSGQGNVGPFLLARYDDPEDHEVFYDLVTPHWAVALLSAVLPFMRLRSFFTSVCRRRFRQCSNCGYDLRATPDRCPECGAIPE
jgi:hypothetical protein